MSGRSFHSYCARPARRGGRIVSGILCLGALATASRLSADDPQALRTLARRYESPGRVFDSGDSRIGKTQQPLRSLAHRYESPDNLFDQGETRLDVDRILLPKKTVRRNSSASVASSTPRRTPQQGAYSLPNRSVATIPHAPAPIAPKQTMVDALPPEPAFVRPSQPAVVQADSTPLPPPLPTPPAPVEVILPAQRPTPIAATLPPMPAHVEPAPVGPATVNSISVVSK